MDDDDDDVESKQQTDLASSKLGHKLSASDAAFLPHVPQLQVARNTDGFRH